MPVTITFSPFPDGRTQLTGFTQFWLRYVYGFSPHFHCQRSLRGFNDPRFRRGMRLGEPLELLAPDRYDYVYLCGVTARKYPGLHLALQPDASATAIETTYNGIVLRVTGARRLPIPPLPDGYAGMSHAFTSCVNWQFGISVYGLGNLRRDLVRE